MALTDILLRIQTHGTLAAKGSELTHIELDDNIIELYEALVNLTGGTGSVAPYNNSTTYNPAPPATYVSYLNNIFLFIAASPTVGVPPPSTATSNATWQLSSIGALAHVQNTDDYLDFGGPAQVSASELAIYLNTSTLIVKTYAEIQTLVAGDDLAVGRWYFISDKLICVFTTGVDRISKNAILFANYQGTGQLDDGLTGVYRTEPILYDFDTDEIYHRWDSLGNETYVPLGSGLTAVSAFPYGYASILGNKVGNCDVSFPTPSATQFANNDVGLGGALTVNSGALVIRSKVEIFNALTFAATAVINDCSVSSNATITIDDTHTGKTLTPASSDFEATLDMNDAGVYNSGTETLTIPTNLNYVGKFTLDNSVTSGNIQIIVNHPASHPCEFSINTATQVDFTPALAGGAANTVINDAMGTVALIIVEDFVVTKKGATQVKVINSKTYS